VGRLQALSGVAFGSSASRATTDFEQASSKIRYEQPNPPPCPRLTGIVGSIETVRDALLDREPALLDQSLHRAIENGNEDVSLLLQYFQTPQLD
jgi:hypothetical protein